MEEAAWQQVPSIEKVSAELVTTCQRCCAVGNDSNRQEFAPDEFLCSRITESWDMNLIRSWGLIDSILFVSRMRN